MRMSVFLSNKIKDLIRKGELWKISSYGSIDDVEELKVERELADSLDFIGWNEWDELGVLEGQLGKKAE